jgi:hypothetical protein
MSAKRRHQHQPQIAVLRGQAMPTPRHSSLLAHVLPLTLLVAAVLISATAVAAPVVYSAFVVTDVSLGGQFYHNAAVTFSFTADTRNITPFNVTAPNGNTGSGVLIDKGRATVRIDTPGSSVRATFVPKQVFVSLDTENGGVGFSAYIGPNGLEPAYPLALDAGTAYQVADLTSPTNVTGSAWSCIGYPPENSGDNGRCFDPTPYPLKTDHGDFIIYSPYESPFLDGTLGPNGGTMNRAIFTVLRPKSN